MTYRGHIKNGQILLDEPADLPEGAAVTVAVATDQLNLLRRTWGHQRGAVLYVAPDFDADLGDDVACHRTSAAS